VEENYICKKHSGFKSKIESLEDNVSKLWDKWDSMQKMIIGIFVTLFLNLVGIITMLIISMTKG